MKEITNYEEYLEKNGPLTYSNVGTSMMPLLRQGKDLFTVTRKGPERCRAGDVVLYKRPPNRYVLHRVVSVRPRDYVILGDNCVSREYGITDRDILGVMTSYVRGKREHSINDTGYRLYTFYIMHTLGPRVAVKKVYFRARRLAKRLIYGKNGKK